MERSDGDDLGIKLIVKCSMQETRPGPISSYT